MVSNSQIVCFVGCDNLRDRTEMDDRSSEEPKLVASLARKWDTWAAENQVTPLPTNYRVDYLRRV